MSTKNANIRPTESDWYYPQPRAGLIGHWDRFIGPGATTLEIAFSLIPSTIAVMAILYYAELASLDWSLVQTIVAALLIFDIVGGVATNATSSAKRWYHRSGQTFTKHMSFVGVHVCQIFLVAWLFRDLDMMYLLACYAYLIGSAILVLLVPMSIQRSSALLLVCGSVIVSEYLFTPTPGFEWFIPILFIKLLISHLCTEEPYV